MKELPVNKTKEKKRILITSTDSMMKQFLEPHVRCLVEHGYEVEIACSEVLKRFDEVREDLGSLVRIHRISLSRSPAAPTNTRGYRELTKIINEGRYDLIWTNEPVMGVMTRMAARQARKKGTRVLYMVHGFHFYQGAPAWNWMAYYPVERHMASKADVICTVNLEDYSRAKTLNVPRVVYIHGIGIDSARLESHRADFDLREELGLKSDDFLVLSVGELNENKNQQVIIRALALLKDPEIHYVLCGIGDKQKELQILAQKLDVDHQTHFLGYRKDIADICRAADIFVMPSRREGLPVASLEAMACGLPMVTSSIRGMTDIMEDGMSGFMCGSEDAEAFAEGIRKLKENEPLRKRAGERNREAVRPFFIENTRQEVLSLIQEMLS